jgi:hypothetical protein
VVVSDEVSLLAQLRERLWCTGTRRGSPSSVPSNRRPSAVSDAGGSCTRGSPV